MIKRTLSVRHTSAAGKYTLQHAKTTDETVEAILMAWRGSGHGLLIIGSRTSRLGSHISS